MYTFFGFGKIKNETYKELFSAAIRVEERKLSRTKKSMMLCASTKSKQGDVKKEGEVSKDEKMTAEVVEKEILDEINFSKS